MKQMKLLKLSAKPGRQPRWLKSLLKPSSVLAFDFDGALAKLVTHPGDAKLTPKTKQLLRRLALHAPIAVITGRGVKDLNAKLEIAAAYQIGNHGLEGYLSEKSSLTRAKKATVRWKKALLKQALPDGVELEDKTYSLAIHYRLAKNKGQVRKDLKQRIAAMSPAPRVIAGKSIFNLVERDAPNKGMALQRLMKSLGSKSALYVGDDDTDEDVFRLNDKNIVTVRVGRKNSSHARYFLRHQTDVNQLLQFLIDAYELRRPHSKLRHQLRH